MTKQQNRWQAGFILLCGLIEIAAFIGTYAASYYTRTRMGMIRHIIYLNGKWERAYTIGTIKAACLAVLVVLSLIICVQIVKRKPRGITAVGAILAQIVGAGAASFIVLSSTEHNRAYYIMALCLMIAAICQDMIYFTLARRKI